jgi:arabinofuranosyltransferase
METPAPRPHTEGSRTLDPRRLAGLGLAVAVLVGAVLGWQKTWFLTDDAYIAFRYASNLLSGWGLVWNPPPFRPVEGYTSFSWVLLLAAVWRVTGIEPPESATVLSLLAGLATLGVTAAFLQVLPLPERLGRRRLELTALTMLGLLTNRTFLTWLSSGLETALFDLLLVGWCLCAVWPSRGRRWALVLSATAAGAALTRPDGLLAVFATPLLLVGAPGAATGWLPLLLVPAHFAWRHATYGEWLPNTWYAKRGPMWPEAGARYFASFVLEYGVWVWFALAFAWLVRDRDRLRRSRGAVLAGGVLLAHFFVYTVDLGGDHFEYRVYSHLPPLLFVAAVWMASRLSDRLGVVAAWMLGITVASWPIAWTHWTLAEGATGRRILVPIADAFPAPVRPVVAAWDGWQAWLIDHFVCVRQEEHKGFQATMATSLPSREEGSELPWEVRAVHVTRSIGVVGWVFPNLAIVDAVGLTDRVVARHAKAGERLMAHDREPPPGYLACFRPDFKYVDGAYRLLPREAPLTDDDIRACEAREW